jgi:hypothetical protein
MPALSDPTTLGMLPLFRGLDPAQLARLNGLLHWVSYTAGANLMTVGQPDEVAYIILTGTV